MSLMRYDDYNLRKLYKAFEPAQRKKALKSAFRRCANEVRKVAINNLRATGISHAEELSSGIRAFPLKWDAGFRVSAASKKANRKGKGEKGMHKNRYGQKKPVLAWAELGTKWRMTKSDSRVKVMGDKGRWFTAGKRRGFMKRYGFMKKTKSQVENSVTNDLRKEMVKSIKRVAKKYGCT